MGNWIILGACLFAVVPCVAKAESVGSVCVASVPASTAGEKTLANPSGGNPKGRYEVRVDRAAAVVLPRGAAPGIWVTGLDLTLAHSFTIRLSGRNIESFRFTFPEGESKYCLYMKPLNLTWQMEKYRPSAWCRCE